MEGQRAEESEMCLRGPSLLPFKFLHFQRTGFSKQCYFKKQQVLESLH